MDRFRNVLIEVLRTAIENHIAVQAMADGGLHQCSGQCCGPATRFCREALVRLYELGFTQGVIDVMDADVRDDMVIELMRRGVAAHVAVNLATPANVGSTAIANAVFIAIFNEIWADTPAPGDDDNDNGDNDDSEEESGYGSDSSVEYLELDHHLPAA